MNPDKNVQKIIKRCVDDVYAKWMTLSDDISTLVFLIALEKAGEESDTRIAEIQEVIEALSKVPTQTALIYVPKKKDMR